MGLKKGEEPGLEEMKQTLADCLLETGVQIQTWTGCENTKVITGLSILSLYLGVVSDYQD